MVSVCILNVGRLMTAIIQSKQSLVCYLFIFLNNKFLMASIVASRLDYTTRDDAILINRHRFECKLNTSHQSKNLFFIILLFIFNPQTHAKLESFFLISLIFRIFRITRHPSTRAGNSNL